jgi:hypothetical protein
MGSEIDTLVRYVLSPATVKIQDLPWKKCCEETIEGRQIGFVVYRGQSENPRFRTVRGTFDPTAIQTNLGRPLSTSKILNMHIVSFASPPNGRLFKIHVTPGVEYVDIRKALDQAREQIDTDEYFAKVLEELPATSTYKKATADKPPATPDVLRTKFWNLVGKENEVILNPTGIYFRSEKSPKETWNRQGWSEDDARQIMTIEDPDGVSHDIEVYETGAFKKPEGAGRCGRTFRRSSRRRNKNGGRLTRQSKRHVRNRHA